MNKKSVLLSVVFSVLVGFFPVPPAPIQAADATTRIEVVFEGNQVFTTDQLRSAMALSGKGSQATSRSNTTDALEQGLQRLREFLIGEGYITLRIGKPQTAQSPAGLIFTVHLEEGSLFRLGELKVTGATVFSEAQIVQALDIKQGDTFRGDAIRIWFERLKDMYANAGYLDWTPIPRQEIKEPESASSDGTVNLTIDMDEGVRVFKIEQRTPPELRPSPLEAFAVRSTATVVWSKQVGQLASRDARAYVTAMTVEDLTGTPSVMRGLRIDLAHGDASPGCDWKYWAWRIMCERPNAAVFIEEERLVEVRDQPERGGAQSEDLRQSRRLDW